MPQVLNIHIHMSKFKICYYFNNQLRSMAQVYSYFAHPNSVCMSYFEHMRLSLGFSWKFLVGSFKAVIHAFFPNAFITSTSDIQRELGEELRNAGCH